MDLSFRNIRFVPCVHRRVTFAEHVRRAALEWRPDVLAVELPATLEPWIVRGAMRLPQISAVCWREAARPGELAYLPIDPCDALIEAVRLGCQFEIPLAFIDLDLPGLQEPYFYIPDDLIIDKSSLADYVATVSPFVSSAETDWAALARESQMALRLKALAAQHERVLCVIGMAHWLRLRELLEQARIAPPEKLAPQAVHERPGAFLAHLSKSSLAEALGEMPYLTWLFEQAREQLELTGEAGFDKLAAIQSILKRAEEEYRQTYKETINLTQWKALLQFTRNLALARGRLRPDLYEVVVGARGIVDGDYGFEVAELASSYPPQDDAASDLPKLKIKDGKGIVEGHEEKYRLLPRRELAPTETVRLNFRRRPSKAMMEFWKQQWRERSFHFGICDWPPESDQQERFMDYIRKRALQIVTEDRRQVEEFTTSLLDGLDIRETTRNWHTGKLYVQSSPPPLGKVGAVVLIHQDEPLEEAEFSWRETLYAEHDNESDISFYARELGEHVVGPRICRTEFGGILSIFPAWGIPNVWDYQLGEAITTCGDTLLAAAIFFSPERYIAWVAPHPPRAALRQMADAYKKHIIYLPLHTFAQSHLKRIRRFHILDGHDVRAWARDFIHED